MKRYSNTKKFLLWFMIVLLFLIVVVISWRSLQRASRMRPAPASREQPKREREAEQEAVPEPPAAQQPSTTEVEVPLEELAKHPHFGWPASHSQVLELVEFSAFALAYNEQHEQAAWVAYRLTAQEKKKRHERYDRFMTDSNVSTGSAEPDDYSNSGYDRGHLAPAGDFATNKQAMKESFYMSNMSPQAPSFNRGIWNKLENRVRDWADEYREVWVITGPVLQNQKRFKKIGPNKVSVPRYYYKIVLDVHEPGIKMIGFVLPNKGSSKELAHFVLAVDSIENLSGLDFFPMLPDQLEETMESQTNTDKWTKLD